MIILAVDDQPIILKSIEHSFKQEDFELIFANDGEEAILRINEQAPDLIILDLNMPNKDGFDVLAFLRASGKESIPVIVMSAEENEDIIVKAFDEGADDYIQKPVGIKELGARARKLLKRPVKIQSEGSRTIHKNIVGVVIPCYNEAERLRTNTFSNFVHENLGYHLCFVNDGSKDNTLEILNELSKGREDYISVYDCAKNGGKAEAVRQGVLQMVKDPQMDYIGYLDADLSTNFNDFEELVNTISNSSYQIVGGSRIARMGANITKESSRAIISKTVNYIIRKILGMTFQDTQCGAKVMTREVAENMFNKPFLTSWLFDVEIFLRMKKHFGSEYIDQLICEQPLSRWIHEDGSKLSMKDSIKIVGQLAQIALHYR